MSHLYHSLYLKKSLPADLHILLLHNPLWSTKSSLNHTIPNKPSQHLESDTSCEISLHSFILNSLSQYCGSGDVENGTPVLEGVQNSPHKNQELGSSSANGAAAAVSKTITGTGNFYLPAFIDANHMEYLIQLLYGVSPAQEATSGIDSSSDGTAESLLTPNRAPKYHCLPLLWLLRVWYIKEESNRLKNYFNRELLGEKLLQNDTGSDTAAASLKEEENGDGIYSHLLEKLVVFLNDMHGILLVEATEPTNTSHNRKTPIVLHGNDGNATEYLPLGMDSQMHQQWMDDLHEWMPQVRRRIYDITRSREPTEKSLTLWKHLSLNDIQWFIKELNYQSQKEASQLKSGNLMRHLESWMEENMDKTLQTHLIESLFSHIRITPDNCFLYRKLFGSMTPSTKQHEKDESSLRMRLKELLYSFIVKIFPTYHEFFLNHVVQDRNMLLCSKGSRVTFSSDCMLLSLLETSQFWNLVDQTTSTSAVIAAYFEYARIRDVSLLKFDVEKSHALSARLKQEAVDMIERNEFMDPDVFCLIEHEDVVLSVLGAIRSVYLKEFSCLTGKISASALSKDSHSTLKTLTNKRSPKINKLRMLFSQFEQNHEYMGRSQKQEFRLAINNLALSIVRNEKKKLAVRSKYESLLTTWTSNWLGIRLSNIFGKQKLFVQHFTSFVPSQYSDRETVLSFLNLPDSVLQDKNMKPVVESMLSRLLCWDRQLTNVYPLVRDKEVCILSELLSTESLLVDSENSVLEIVLDILQQRQLSNEEKLNLVKAIRCEHLSTLCYNRFITNDQIDPAYRLNRAMHLSQLAVGNDHFMSDRSFTTHAFPYSASNETDANSAMSTPPRGILFALGQNLHSEERFRNPCSVRRYLSIDTRLQPTPAGIENICDVEGEVQLIGCHGEAIELSFFNEFQVQLSGVLINVNWSVSKKTNWSVEVSLDGQIYHSVYEGAILPGIQYWQLPKQSQFVQYVRLVYFGFRSCAENGDADGSLAVDESRQDADTAAQGEKFFEASQCGPDVTISRVELFGSLQHKMSLDRTFVLQNTGVGSITVDRYMEKQLKHTKKCLCTCLHNMVSQSDATPGVYKNGPSSYGYVTEDILDCLLLNSKEQFHEERKGSTRIISFPDAQYLDIGDAPHWNQVVCKVTQEENSHQERQFRVTIRQVTLLFDTEQSHLQLECSSIIESRRNAYERWA